jgi:hypothetical protein
MKKVLSLLRHQPRVAISHGERKCLLYFAYELRNKRKLSFEDGLHGIDKEVGRYLGLSRSSVRRELLKFIASGSPSSPVPDAAEPPPPKRPRFPTTSTLRPLLLTGVMSF